MNKFRYIAIAAAVCSLFFNAVQEAGAQGLSEEQVRRIVREEFKAREKELSERERRLTERENQLKLREDKSAAAVPEKSVNVEPVQTASADTKAVTAPGPFSIELEGYADVQADWYDYSETGDTSEGSRGQSRSTFDTERFVVELEGKHEPTDLSFEAEIEFEHGGTGGALELEHDEFGEFESEVEKGGEVIVEELYVGKDFGNGLSGKLGRFYVALNTLSQYYHPTDYLAVRRPEVEEVMLPGQWDEIGVSLTQQLDFGSATFQIVNGLDSTGFGSEQWVASGHQSRFESIRAQDLAAVGRVDVNALYPGLTVGGSIYAGNTTQNRPTDDLDDVDGTVVIGGLNYRYWSTSLKLQGAAYLGHLSDAEEISARNARLSNNLGVDRTPIGDEALGTWSEIGWNVGPVLGSNERHELIPFFRFDYYDTLYDTREELIDNPRYERRLYTAGMAYMYDSFLSLKLNWSRRTFGQSDLSDQDIIGFGLGLVY